METLYFPKLGFGIELNRVAFSIGDFHIYWYGILIALAFLAGLVYAFCRARTFGLDPDRMIDAIIGGVIGGVVGARLYFVAYNLDYYLAHPGEIIKTWEGGMAIYGGIIGALLVAWLVCRWRKVRVLPMFDLAASGFLIGQAIGRWGNFINMEAFGTNTDLPWGMTSQTISRYLAQHKQALSDIGVTVSSTEPVHPCFLYESLWCLIGFILLALYTKHRKFDGEIFLMYIAWYGAGRTVIEGLRTDSLMLGSIRISQLLALVSCIAALFLIFFIRHKIKRNADPNYLPLYVNTEEAKDFKAFLQKEEEKKQQKKEEKAAQKAKRKADIARAEALYEQKRQEKKRLEEHPEEDDQVIGDPLEPIEEGRMESPEAEKQPDLDTTMDDKSEAADEDDSSESENG